MTRIKTRKVDAVDSALLLAPAGRHVYSTAAFLMPKAPAGRHVIM